MLGTISLTTLLFHFFLRLSFTLTAICVISALSAAACLVIAGGVGQSCHPHGNLSHVLQLVVDDTSTWRGSYLLGQAIQGNSSFPLTFEKFLGSCRRNDSLYQVLKLDQKFYLDAYFSLPSTAMVNVGLDNWGSSSDFCSVDFS